MKTRRLPVFFCALIALSLPACASNRATSAEEYYSIGMAYYEMGKYTEAEQWLARAGSANKTQVASEYQRGRIAFETGRFRDAAKHFEDLLKKDPENVMALRAAAYTRIKTGELETSRKLYEQIVRLVPESADDGYNYALVLYATRNYAEAETTLLKYKYSMPENKDTLLLLARSQNALNKIEAADNYDSWLQKNKDGAVRFEYAQILEDNDLYARALEEYRKALEEFTEDTELLTTADIRFSLARLTLTIDPENESGITELQEAIDAGYKDEDALQQLYEDERVLEKNREEIRKIIATLAGNEPETPEDEETGEEAASETPE
jgi:tetratricopeptide (TPR) repeat protein